MESIPGGRRPVTAGLILAGGKSLRMGSDKALQPLGGKAVIAHVLERMGGLVDHIYVVANDLVSYSFLGVPTILDEEPGSGPLMGMYTGISASRTPWVLAVACDTPFVAPSLLRTLLQHPRMKDIVAVEVGSQPQPFPALYSARCAGVARTLLNSGHRALRDLMAAVDVSIIPEAAARQVDPHLRTFLDLDTNEDLRSAQRIIGDSARF